MIKIKYIIQVLLYVFIAVSLSGCFHNKSGSATATPPTPPTPIVGTPTADAGVDQDVATGSMVTLDGSGSADPQNDPVTYIWTQTIGPDVTSGSGNLTGEAPSFTAPVNNVSTVQFSLVVSNGTNSSSTDSVQINVMEDPNNALFVDGDNGNDITGTGSRSNPFASIGTALSAGGMIIPPDVYVQSRSVGASYVESTTLQVQNGTSLYGGFDSSWVRNTRGNRSLISGASKAIDFSSIGSDTWLSGFEITASTPVLASIVVTGVNVGGGTAVLYLQDNIITTNNVAAGASANSASNYGVKVVGLFGLVITDNTVTSGNAGNGSNGSTAANGTNALNNAQQGSPGAISGGGGGTGGAGGINPGNSALNGAAGGNGGLVRYNGQPGGGNGGSVGNPGGNGIAGVNGISGTHSTNAGNGYGSIAAGSFTRSNGGVGSPGDDGTPGGSGGGGGGGISFSSGGTGGGGGGGGAAGSGGSGGQGGTGGSASIGIFVLNTTNLTMSNNTVTAGSGGNAGGGAYGGGSGLGGNGALGGTGGFSAGNGGAGAAGGNGGVGGEGAGGGGGPSFAIYLDNILAFDVTGNTAQSGIGGSGGYSSNGTAGDGGFSYGLFTNNLAPGTGPAMDAANSLTGGTGGTAGSSENPGGNGSTGLSGAYIDF